MGQAKEGRPREKSPTRANGCSAGMSVENRTQADEETTAPDEQPQENAPVQYYSRSELPQRQLALHRFSPQRKSTLIAVSLIMTVALIVAGAAATTRDLTGWATWPS